MKLLLQRLEDTDDGGREYVNQAVWQPDSGEAPPEEFTSIYPENEWRERTPAFFIERIDGPYSILTEIPDDQDVTIPGDDSTGTDGAETTKNSEGGNYGEQGN